MTHVHYKFSSKLSYDTVLFDGPHITLMDLKRQIMGREKLRAGDCDLQIINAQTKEEYTDDEGLIPKGSSVIVRRIPIIRLKSSSNSKTRIVERSDVQLHNAFGAIKANDDQSSSRALPLFSKMANLAHADVSEEDKIKVMINQSTYDSMNYNKKLGAALPANYTCYRCGQTGHHIRSCPTSGVKAEQDKNSDAPLKLKKSTGIPRSFMVEVDDPNIKGAMLTKSGHYAIPAIHAKAYAIGKKEKPPFVPQEQPESKEKEDPVPDELLCLICHDLLSDAVVIPCCGNSYCDDCIRTTLLDSEEHVCPTCGQSDVSPDTLIANKFLRQAVNTFMKERGHAKSLRERCGTSQSQNLTMTPSLVPTPPSLTIQSQPQKPHQSTHSLQDPLMHCSQAADKPSSSQVCGAPPAATGPAPVSHMPSTPLQPVQSHLEISDKEAEEKTNDGSEAATPSVLVSHKDPTAATSQLISLVNHPPEVEQPQTDSVNLQQTSSGQAPRHSGPLASWESSSSSSPTGGWREKLPPFSSSSSSYPASHPPLFPPPHFPTFLAAQQPFTSYPPGYPPATPVWTLPTPQAAPIPSFSSSTSTSSIPTLIPKEWYMHQRKMKERSPHRGSTYRRSSSRPHSKSSKSKSSRSYSRSVSRSRSRSRSKSKGRSRPHSPYSRHRDHHNRSHSHSSHSYSYGYKRSPTPSSSSSPRAGYRSRSKSPSDQHKNRHHSRHHNKKSTSSSYSSRRRGECSQREEGGSEVYSQNASQTSSQELERMRYLQWKKQYKEWCEKYLNSYVGHFHHLPPPPLNLPHFLPPPPHWGDREESRNQSHDKSEFHNQLHSRRTVRMDGRSPPSESSSDSRSSPSQSSSDSRSTPSQSSSDSRSSPSHSSNDSRSPPSQSSSGGRSTLSKEGAQPRAYQQMWDEKYSRLPITLKKGSKERSKDDKHLNVENLKDLSTMRHKQKNTKKHEEGRREEYSSPAADDSMDDCSKDKRRQNTGPKACKDGTPLQDKATASEALESVQQLMNPDKDFDKDYIRKTKEQKNLDIEKEWGSGKCLDSRQDVERQHKKKPNKEAGQVGTDKNPGGSKASDSRSEKNRKRRGEDVGRSSEKFLKTEIGEVPEIRESESPNPFDKKKPKVEKKMERKTWPQTESNIWEGGIKVKPQKKISININLDGKRKEEENEKPDSSYLESTTGKTKEEMKTGNGEEKFNRGQTEVNEKKESGRDPEDVSEEKIKPDGEAAPKWEKATFTDDQREVLKKQDVREMKEDKKEEDFDLWRCALRGVQEKSKKQWEQRDEMEASKGEEVTNDQKSNMRGGKEEMRRMRNDGRVEEMGELVAGTQERAEGESTCKENIENPTGNSKPKSMRKEEKDTTSSKSQRSKNESHHDGPSTSVDDGSSCEDRQERKVVVKTLEEYTEGRAADREDELVFIQVPRSKWDKEESEEEGRDEGEIKVQTDSLQVFLPSSAVSVTTKSPTDRQTEGEHEQQRHRETERDSAGEMQRGRDREREKNSTLFSSQRIVAPSSGSGRPDCTLSTDRDKDRERKVKKERPRERERGRESERPKDRQKESKRSKKKTWEEEKGRDRERERGHSSNVTVQKRNPPSTSHSHSYLTSRDIERRDEQRGGDQDSNESSFCSGRKSSSGTSWESDLISRAAELPDQNAHETYTDTLLDLKFKDQNYSHYYNNPYVQSGIYGHHDRQSYHSPLSLSHIRGKEKDPLPSESSQGSELIKPRMNSPDRELLPTISRNESKVEKGEWKGNKVYKVIKEGKGERDSQDMVAERGAGSRWEEEADELDGLAKWERGRKLEERERSSSYCISSSASQESSSDDWRNEWKRKQKKQKKETRKPAPELLEEGELRKQNQKKKSKKSRDGGEDESGGEVDDMWKEEEDHAKLCSVMLF